MAQVENVPLRELAIAVSDCTKFAPGVAVSSDSGEYGIIVSVDEVNEMAHVLWSDTSIRNTPTGQKRATIKHMAREIRDEIDADILRDLYTMHGIGNGKK
jgi:hypothetical protein